MENSLLAFAKFEPRILGYFTLLKKKQKKLTHQLAETELEQMRKNTKHVKYEFTTEINTE